MSGEDLSVKEPQPQQPQQVTAKDRLAKWDDLLDDYEKSLGIPKLQPPGTEDELNQYLTMNRDHLEKLSYEDCGYIIVRLAQFSTFVQRNFNREKARANWAKSQIRSTIAMEVNNFKGYSYDERAAQAINNNTHASSLYKIQQYAESRAERLFGISASMQGLADFIKNLQYTKRK